MACGRPDLELVDIMLVLTLTLGCWTPQTTGPNTMVGTVVDADGAPIAELSVQSIEASTVTGADGQFGLSYKEPTRFVWFTKDQVTFERHYRPDDLGTSVVVHTPAVAPRAFSCEMDTTCEVRLVWDLGEGTRAIVRGLCDTEERRVRFNAPATGSPVEAWCRDPATPGAPDVALHVADGGTHVRLTPPWVTLDVAVSADPDDAPDHCEVRVDGEVADRGAPGHWTRDVFGNVTIAADCDGVPATPKRLILRNPAGTTVRWHRVTPELDLREIAPGAQSVWLRAVEGDERGWDLTLSPNARGTFTLPRLPQGGYLVTVDLEPARSQEVSLASDEQTVDLLQLIEVPNGTGQPAFVGALRTSGHVDGGVVPVVMLAEAFAPTSQ